MLGFENRKFGDTYIFSKYVLSFFLTFYKTKFLLRLSKFLSFTNFFMSTVNTGYKYINELKIATFLVLRLNKTHVRRKIATNLN